MSEHPHQTPKDWAQHLVHIGMQAQFLPSVQLSVAMKEHAGLNKIPQQPRGHHQLLRNPCRSESLSPQPC